MKALMIAALPITTALILIGCNTGESYYCSDAGFRYIEKTRLMKSSMAPDFNKLGLPKRCERADEKE